MARPQKQTIDYFPHYVNQGKTLLILQNDFGNDGYAFWYRLLELLCKSENQQYDFDNPAAWRLLIAETHVSDEIALKIINTLAELEAIDSELAKNKIIWIQNLVDNLELVYNRRSTGKPQKPVIANNNPVIVNNNPVNVCNNRHTILNNTKQNNTKQDSSREDIKSSTSLETLKKKNKVTKKETDPRVNDLFELIKNYYNYIPGPESHDPIPSYGSEGKAIKTMLNRNFSVSDIFDCWRAKTAQKEGYCLMAYVNRDIKAWLDNGKKLPGINRNKNSIPGNRPAGAFDDLDQAGDNFKLIKEVKK